MRNYYIVAEIEEITNLSRVTISKYSKLGIIKRIGYNRYDKSSVDTFLNMSHRDRRTAKANVLRSNPDLKTRTNLPTHIIIDLAPSSTQPQPDPYQAVQHHLKVKTLRNRPLANPYPGELPAAPHLPPTELYFLQPTTPPTSEWAWKAHKNYLSHLRNQRPDMVISTLPSPPYEINQESIRIFKTPTDFTTWKTNMESLQQEKKEILQESQIKHITFPVTEDHQNPQPFVFLDDPYLARQIEEGAEYPLWCSRMDYNPLIEETVGGNNVGFAKRTNPTLLPPKILNMGEDLSMFTPQDLLDPVPALQPILQDARAQEREVMEYFQACMNTLIRSQMRVDSESSGAKPEDSLSTLIFSSLITPVRNSTPTLPGGLRTYDQLKEILEAANKLKNLQADNWTEHVT